MVSALSAVICVPVPVPHPQQGPLALTLRQDMHGQVVLKVWLHPAQCLLRSHPGPALLSPGGPPACPLCWHVVAGAGLSSSAG